MSGRIVIISRHCESAAPDLQVETLLWQRGGSDVEETESVVRSEHAKVCGAVRVPAHLHTHFLIKILIPISYLGRLALRRVVIFIQIEVSLAEWNYNAA